MAETHDLLIVQDREGYTFQMTAEDAKAGGYTPVIAAPPPEPEPDLVPEPEGEATPEAEPEPDPAAEEKAREAAPNKARKSARNK